MAKECKPNIEGLKKEGKIKFFSTYNDDNGSYDKLETLIDGNLKSREGNGYGVFLSYYNYIEFELFQKSNIYTYEGSYSDSGGSTPQPITLYKKNKNGEYEIYKEHIGSTKRPVHKWNLLLEKLPKGIYKLKADNKYVIFLEWYIENLEPSNFLLKQNNKYYSIKSDFYKDGNYQDLGIDTIADDDFRNKGFSGLEELVREVTNITTKSHGEQLDDGRIFSFSLDNSFKEIVSLK